MNDPWKYPAFAAAAIAGYLVSLVATQQFAQMAGTSEFVSRIVVIGGTGLFAGFLVDELIPAYLENVRSGGGAGGRDMDFDDGDLDFDS